MRALLSIFFIASFFSCSPKKDSTTNPTLYYNGTITTLDEGKPSTDCLVEQDGKVIALGTYEDLTKTYPNALKVDLKGGFVYPGFIDAHCHFYRYGIELHKLNLKGCSSEQDMIARVLAHSKTHPHGWIHGRGWDHTTWKNNTLPSKRVLDSLFPNRPVLLKRIDGHAALANSKALKLANITNKTIIPGGEVLKEKGTLTGILIDNAVDSVFALIPEPSRAQKVSGTLEAQRQCIEKGLTTVVCAGLEIEDVLIMDSLHQTGDLKLHVYAMLNPSKKNFEWVQKRKGKPYISPKMHIQSFKLYADGSLGSRGALLKESYCDKKNHFGLPVLSYSTLDSFTRKISQWNFQVNTHCIGDSANAMMLKLYGKYLGDGKDKRWRIEHAQVVDPSDLHLFSKYGILPSVQPTHATSDMRWAAERLCEHRMNGAYAYKNLLNVAGMVALGTDFPVEGIDPLETFYAAVFRSKENSAPFLPAQALSPEEALKGMTQWAAYSCFQEKEKGSLSIGKQATFVVLNKELLTITMGDFKQLKVLETYIDGEKMKFY